MIGNVKGLQDPYRNPTTQKGFAETWGQNPAMVTSFADGSKISFEQAIVANATGFTVEQRGMSRGLEYRRRRDDDRTALRRRRGCARLGGIVDYVVGTPLTKVYVLAEHHDPKQRHYLELYKMGEGPLYSFFVPYHLVHFEVPNSIARVALFRDPVSRALGGPIVEVCAVAKRDLKAGETLDDYGEYMTYGEAVGVEEMSSGRLSAGRARRGLRAPSRRRPRRRPSPTTTSSCHPEGSPTASAPSSTSASAARHGSPRQLQREQCLPARKRLGIPLGGDRFHAAKPHEAQEGLTVEPVLARLAGEVLLEEHELLFDDRSSQRHVDVGPTKVPVDLGNLILENQVVPEGVPGEFACQPVILMEVVAGVGEHDLRIDPQLQRLEEIFDLCARIGEKAVAEPVHLDPGGSEPGKKGSGAPPGLLLSFSGRREHDPVDLEGRVRAGERQQRSATPDLDVVRVTADREDATRWLSYREMQHPRPPARPYRLPRRG